MGGAMRFFTSLLLAACLAALAVPLGMHLVPAVVQAVGTEPAATPDYLLPPQKLSAMTTVTTTSEHAPVPANARLKQLLDAQLRLDGSGDFTATVLDAAGGSVLYDRQATRARMPASNLKILTAAAALSTLGADATFDTAALLAGGSTVVLRGGGDVLLGSRESDAGQVVGRAGLTTLAQSAAAALAAKGIKGTLKVQLDDSLFVGPVLNPGWADGDVAAGEIAPVYPLAMNSAWLNEGQEQGPRAPDPALAAGEAFRQALAAAGRDRGFTVATDIDRSGTPSGAVQLAAVHSATVAEQVRHMLLTSDNYLAEALARMTAIGSGKAASFGGGTEAVREAVGRLGVPIESLTMADASGLSARNQVSAAQLAATVQAIINSPRPAVRKALAGFPVAGLSGTLEDRGSAAGDGLVRGKAGTLNAVTSLSGFVVDADGRLLAFSFVANGLKQNTAQARDAVDAAAGVLAGCGCR